MTNLESKRLSKHLRHIKAGEEDTSLAIATKGNGAKVDGNLEVTGYTDNIKLREEAIVKADGNVKLDSDGDITLNASGADISFAVNNTAYLTWTGGGQLLMKAAADIDDYLQFNVTNNGISTISTNDDTGGNLADLTLDAEGDITLNSKNGIFIMENDGTEFSVSNSSYAGMILGYTTVGIDATTDSYTLTTTMTCLDDAMKVKFVAPPSRTVEIFAQLYLDASRRAPVLGLSDASATTGYSPIDFPNSNDVTNEHILAVPPSANGDHMLHPHWVVSGLTAGTSYEWWIAAKTSLGTGGVLKWGGTATSQMPPFIMKATALPAATTDYAVYG